MLYEVITVLHLDLHGRIEEAHAVSSSRLGLIHGEVGLLQHFVDAVLMAAEQADAHAG